MATVCKALGISLETTFTSKSGRPMKIANSGKVIKELFATPPVTPTMISRPFISGTWVKGKRHPNQAAAAYRSPRSNSIDSPVP
jgi:hypothetical protein